MKQGNWGRTGSCKPPLGTAQVGATLAALCMLACSSSDGPRNDCDPDDVCPYISAAQLNAGEWDGEISWQWNDGNTTSEPPGPTLLPPRECWARLDSARTLPASPLRQIFTVECVDEPRHFQLRTVLPDLRTIDVGSYPTLVRQEIGSWYTDDTSPDDGSCSVELPEDFASVEVDEAQGGFAPFTEVVTADFLREIRIDFALTEPIVGTRRGESCTTSLLVWGSIQFTISADHYAGYPDAPCECGA